MSEIIRNYERVAYGLRSEYVCVSCFLTSPFVFKKFILYGIVKDLSELRPNSNPNLYFVRLHHKLYSVGHQINSDQ